MGSKKKEKGEKKKKRQATVCFENNFFLKLLITISTECSYLSMLLNTSLRERQVNSSVAQVVM